MMTKILVAALGLCVVVIYEILVGKGRYLADAISIIAAALITACLWYLFNGKGPVSGWGAIRITLGFVLLAWTIISLVDIKTRSGPFWTPRAATSAHVTATQPSARIAVSLSGGGYRAALFHAGVLSELERLGVSVQAISAVSGGSIVGSFYAVGGTPEAFRTAVVEQRFNLKRELVNLTAIWRFTRADVQANMLDRLFLNAIKHQDTPKLGRPELMVCTTDIAAGELIGVTPYGIVSQPIASAAARSSFINPANVGLGSTYPPHFNESADAGLPGDRRLAELVAASGAYPAAFNPVYTDITYVISPERKDTKRYVLADGGIGDNLGSVLAYSANHLAQYAANARAQTGSLTPMAERAKNWKLDKWNVDLIIVSDGSAISPRTLPTSMLGEIGNALESMYLSTGGDQMRGKVDSTLSSPPAILISPRTIISPFSLQTLTNNPKERLTHLFFGTELVLRHNPPGEPAAVISFTSIDPETLESIIRNMPETEQRRADQLKSELAQQGVLRDGLWQQPTWLQGSPERQLFDLILDELDRRVKAFIRTSTLDDQLDRDSAESIYLLGQYMTRLNKPYILRYAKPPAS